MGPKNQLQVVWNRGSGDWSCMGPYWYHFVRWKISTEPAIEGLHAACPTTNNAIIPGAPWNTGMGSESKYYTFPLCLKGISYLY